MASKKKLFIGIGLTIFVALVIGTVFISRKLDEVRIQKDQEYFSQPANMVGRWVSDDGSLSFLIYTAETILDPSYRIRVDLEDIDFSGPSIIEGKVPTTRAYIRYLEVLADSEDWVVQLGLEPLRKLGEDNNCFEARVIYHTGSGFEDREDLGTFTFRKDTNFVEEGTAELSQTATETITAALNEACNSYYTDAEVSVAYTEFDTPGTAGVYGEGVNYDGYIHGTCLIAPTIKTSVFLELSQIEFYIDPAADPMRVYYLENTTLGQTIVSNYEVQ